MAREIRYRGMRTQETRNTERAVSVTLAPEHLNESVSQGQDPPHNPPCDPEAGTHGSGDWANAASEGQDDLTSVATTVRW